MQKILQQGMMALGMCMMAASPVLADENVSLKSFMDKVSYGIGVEMGRNFRQQGVEVDTELMVRGLKDALAGKQLLLSEKDLRLVVNEFQGELRRKQLQNRKIAGEENRKAGEAFLAEHAKKPGVVILPSGLQYRVVKSGSGKLPTDADAVECHYRGTLLDGKVFDSSYDRGTPATFKLASVIAGWREALKLMPVGSTWELVVPAQLAYGERGAGRDIGPNATLVFEVELLAIKPATEGGKPKE